MVPVAGLNDGFWDTKAAKVYRTRIPMNMEAMRTATKS